MRVIQVKNKNKVKKETKKLSDLKELKEPEVRKDNKEIQVIYPVKTKG